MQQGDALAHGDQGSLMGCGDAACGKSTVSVGGFRCAAALVPLDGLGGALSAGLSASSVGNWVRGGPVVQRASS